MNFFYAFIKDQYSYLEKAKNNIQFIKSEIDPFGVDLSSGVEKDLGIKDIQTINNFIGKINYA